MTHTTPCIMCGKMLTSKEPLLTRRVVCSKDCSIAAQIEATAKAINNDESNVHLYQSINKEHMESYTGQTITDEEWRVFVDRLQDSFANEVSELATEFWNDYDPMDWEA